MKESTNRPRTRTWDRHGNGGITLTELGLGTAPIANLYRAISSDEARVVLETAWMGGVRHYDTAPLYGLGLAETRLNSFLRERARNDFILSSKVGRLLSATTPEKRHGVGFWYDVPNRQEVYDYTYSGVMRSTELSLERLGVDYFDILYVHDLDLASHKTHEAWQARLEEFFDRGGYKALEELREQGITRAIGGGMNEWRACQAVAERGDFDIFLLAGRYTLLEQDALRSFFPICQKRGIGIVIGGPYNSGILATGPVSGARYNYALASEDIRERVKRIEDVCRSHHVRLIDAAFNFPLLHPVVLSVVPGCQTKQEMEAALRTADTRMPAELWTELKAEGLLDQEAPTDA